ncbi:MAG: four helix bundle protein [Deltaproteobacteria bacterium]|nr:four helix bundle protein [Deltaproteobacteria bacterium]
MYRDGRSFRGLLVWRQAMDLAKSCYHLTKTLPREERYGLTSQIRRAAISIPANIAEGNGRSTRGAYVSFLRIAQGSLRELETYLLFLIEAEMVRAEAVEPVLQQLDSVARLLNRLIQSLQSDPLTA